MGLKRRLRGYDREETEKLLAQVGQGYETLRARHAALSEELGKLRREQEGRELEFRRRLDTLSDEVQERERRIADLDAEIARHEEERSTRLAELSDLREELADARAGQERAHQVLLEQHERIARLETRERAWREQISMLSSQLEQEEPAELLPTRARALPESAGRVASMLVRFDHAVSTLEQETRREAELILKKARRRADQIIQSAEAQRHRLAPGHGAARDQGDGEEYDPIAALERIERRLDAAEATDPLESRIGEASWTSRRAYGHSPADRDTLR